MAGARWRGMHVRGRGGPRRARRHDPLRRGAQAAAAAEVGMLSVPTILSKAPYDIFGDTMRGMRGVMLDTFRKRSELIEAMD